MRRYAGALALCAVSLFACQKPAQDAPPPDQEAQAAMPEPGTPEWKIASAISAAPPELAPGATVMDWAAEPGGAMAELRKGTNGWTCMPDIPTTPGNDPMCLDEAFLNWAAAWMSKTQPNVGGVGFGYMLQGGTDASNTDPYATEPRPGETWVKSGPHIMVVVPDPAALEGISSDPESGGPFVMFTGTPYAHVMVPIAGPGS